MKLRLLGCGTSTGVPRIGNDWGSCDPAEPRNRRTRCSAIVETATTRVLIDTGPEMRAQLLAADVGTIDAVIWTHDHADHVHGLDDLRQLAQNARRAVRGFARTATAEGLTARFGYVFHGRGPYPRVVAMETLPDRFAIGDIDISCVDQPHGSITSAGLMFERGGKRIVYSTDFHELTPEMSNLFEGCDIWLLDALRRTPHPSHNHLDAALGYVERVRPARAVLIHMDNSMDYATLAAALPQGIEPGYDGMELIP